MIKTHFVFAVSFVAMLAVCGGARAEIAGVSYVDRGVTAANTAAGAAQTSANNAQTSANAAQSAADAAQASADAAAASAKTANDAIAGLDLTAVGSDGSYIKTVSQTDGKVSATEEAADTTPTSGSKKMVTSGGVYTALSGKLSTTGTAAKATADASGNVITTTYATKAEVAALNADTMAGDIATLQEQVESLESDKVTTAQGSSAASKAVITNSSGNITTGTIATGMITDSAVTSAKIADGTVALADLASNSVNSAKIVDASIATADIAAGAVTAAKTTGIYGYIPSGSEGSTTTATIWVE